MEKHLEFAQGLINRMAQNSFFIKGWTITLISALFALAAKDANQRFMNIAYFPLLTFWLLDSYYLYQERLFRKVYNHVRRQRVADFSLSTKAFDKKIVDYLKAAFSITIVMFYGAILITLLILTFYIK